MPHLHNGFAESITSYFKYLGIRPAAASSHDSLIPSQSPVALPAYNVAPLSIVMDKLVTGLATSALRVPIHRPVLNCLYIRADCLVCFCYSCLMLMFTVYPMGDYVLSYFDHTLVLKKGDIGLQGPPCFNSLLMCKAGGAHACTTAKVNCIPWPLVIKNGNPTCSDKVSLNKW